MEGYGITRFSAIYYGQPSSQLACAAPALSTYMGVYDAFQLFRASDQALCLPPGTFPTWTST